MIRSMHNNRWLICILILGCGCEGEPDAPPASEPVVGAGPEVVLPEDYFTVARANTSELESPPTTDVGAVTTM